MVVENESTSREVRALVLATNRALDRLEQAMQTLESFTADAAHKMRTPLSILKLRDEALESGPAKDALREDVAAMTRLVNQMLDTADNAAAGAAVFTIQWIQQESFI